MTTAAEIADTILEQLGGRRFTMMTGAKNLLSHEDGSLSFRLPNRFANDGINYVKVTLDWTDTYRVEFGRVWGLTYKVIRETSGVYADGLQDAFRNATGLETKL